MDPLSGGGLPASPPAAPPRDPATRRPAVDHAVEIRRAAAGLEEALLRQALQAMSRAQLESGGFFGSGAAEGSYQTTFEMLLSEALAQGTPLGLADRVAAQLTRDPKAAAAAETARDLARDATSAPVFRNFTRDPQVQSIPAEKKGWTATDLPITGSGNPVRRGAEPGPAIDQDRGRRTR